MKDGGLTVRWLPPRHSAVGVDHYLVEYRTVGQWVPLTSTALLGCRSWSHINAVAYSGSGCRWRTVTLPSTTITVHTDVSSTSSPWPRRSSMTDDTRSLALAIKSLITALERFFFLSYFVFFPYVTVFSEQR